jgi:hypothetical protein
MRFHWTTVVVLLVAAAGPAFLGGQSAKENKPMDLTPYKLPDDLFWTTTNRSSDPMPMRLLGQYNGVLVGAPAVVPIDLRKTLPAAIYYLGPVRQVASVKWDDHGIITAMDLQQNRLYAMQARELITESDAIKSPRPNLDQLPKGSMANVRSMDLRQFLKLPWEPTRFLLTAMLRDQVSNRAEVKLRRSESAYQDPEVAKYLEAERARMNPPPPAPPAGVSLPNYHRMQESPEIPEGPGIRMVQARVADLGRSARVPLYGSFLLPALPQEVVKQGYVEPRPVARDNRPAEARPLAVIGITLLITGADDGSLFVVPMHVPASSRAAGDDGRTVVTGYFALDLQSVGMNTTNQTYFIYAFSGESMAGPLACALVGRRQHEEEYEQ